MGEGGREGEMPAPRRPPHASSSHRVSLRGKLTLLSQAHLWDRAALCVSDPLHRLLFHQRSHPVGTMGPPSVESLANINTGS